jgi:hypothetical protein
MIKGGVLIGGGFLPSQTLVQDAIKRGDLKNCTRATTLSLPSEKVKRFALAVYVRCQRENGWDDPGELMISELTTSQGRKMWAVYPKNP